jgi:hypothetical protein
MSVAMRVGIVLAGAVLWVACGGGPASTPADTPQNAEPAFTAPKSAGAVPNRAPHGGSLVRLGDDVAYLEFVLDPSSGNLTAYVLQGDAWRSQQLPAPGIDLRVTPPGRPAVAVTLEPMANALTGERVGDTSQFAAVVPGLEGQTNFTAVVVKADIKGNVIGDVSFTYPQ